MKIIVESHIPYIANRLDDLGHVVRLAPEQITPESVADADALIVRTRTRCDASLLRASRVRFVATATIGTDHIDRQWCNEAGIATASAPGCNAPAVAQYVWASLLRLMPYYEGKTVGVIGLGHVGSIVADWGQRLGVRVLACDPPRALRDGGWSKDSPAAAGNQLFVDIATIARESDAVTFHTPLNLNGEYATYHLANAEFFSALNNKPIVINAARGPILDTEAMLMGLRAGRVSHAVIDCWEGEPHLSDSLLEKATIATPHIAGYSIEGKQRAADACVGALRRFVDAKPVQTAFNPLPGQTMPTGGKDLADRIMLSYNPFVDTYALKAAPGSFENLRNNYSLRHEP